MSKLSKLEEVALAIYASDIRTGVYDSFLIADSFLKTSETRFKNNKHNQADVRQIKVKDYVEVKSYDFNSIVFNGNEILNYLKNSEKCLIEQKVISPVNAYEVISSYVECCVKEKIKIMNS